MSTARPKQWQRIDLTNATLVQRRFGRNITPPGLARLENMYISPSDGAPTLRPKLIAWDGDSYPTKSVDYYNLAADKNFSEYPVGASGIAGSDTIVMFTNRCASVPANLGWAGDEAQNMVNTVVYDEEDENTVTCDLSNASATVTGTNSRFLKRIWPGCFISFDEESDLFYVSSVDSDTQLTVSPVNPNVDYSGSTITIHQCHNPTMADGGINAQSFAGKIVYSVPSMDESVSHRLYSGPFSATSSSTTKEWSFVDCGDTISGGTYWNRWRFPRDLPTSSELIFYNWQDCILYSLDAITTGTISTEKDLSSALSRIRSVEYEANGSTLYMVRGYDSSSDPTISYSTSSDGTYTTVKDDAGWGSIDAKMINGYGCHMSAYAGQAVYFTSAYNSSQTFPPLNYYLPVLNYVTTGDSTTYADTVETNFNSGGYTFDILSGQSWGGEWYGIDVNASFLVPGGKGFFVFAICRGENISGRSGAFLRIFEIDPPPTSGAWTLNSSEIGDPRGIDRFLGTWESISLTHGPSFGKFSSMYTNQTVSDGNVYFIIKNNAGDLFEFKYSITSNVLTKNTSPPVYPYYGMDYADGALYLSDYSPIINYSNGASGDYETRSLTELSDGEVKCFGATYFDGKLAVLVYDTDDSNIHIWGGADTEVTTEFSVSNFKPISESFRARTCSVLNGYCCVFNTSEYDPLAQKLAHFPRRFRWSAPGEVDNFAIVRGGGGSAELKGIGPVLDSIPVNGRIITLESDGIGAVSPRGDIFDPWQYDVLSERVKPISNAVTVGNRAYFVASDGVLYVTNGITVTEAENCAFDITEHADFDYNTPVQVSYNNILDAITIYYTGQTSNPYTVYLVSAKNHCVSTMTFKQAAASGDWPVARPESVFSPVNSTVNNLLVGYPTRWVTPSTTTLKFLMQKSSTSSNFIDVAPYTDATFYGTYAGVIDTGEIYLVPEGYKTIVSTIKASVYASGTNNAPQIGFQVKSNEDSVWNEAGDDVGTVTVVDATSATGTGTALRNRIAAGDGVTKVFTVPCMASIGRYYSFSVPNETLLVEGTDYTVTGTNEITLTNALSGGTYLNAYWSGYPFIKVSQENGAVDSIVGIYNSAGDEEDIIAYGSGSPITATSVSLSSLTGAVSAGNKLFWIPSKAIPVEALAPSTLTEHESELYIGIHKLCEGLRIKVIVINRAGGTNNNSENVKVAELSIGHVPLGNKIIE